MNEIPGDSINYTAIGIFNCEERHRYELARQGSLGKDNIGTISLHKHCNFEQALEDIHGFSHIWLLYDFHLNKTWKPLVRPPRINDKRKVSVFATRSPYRPNSIGMSCVELMQVDKLTLYVRNFDLIDETPILDIKPYLPYSDSHPEASRGWLPEDDNEENYFIHIEPSADEQIKWLYEKSGLDLKRFAYIQLQQNPLDSSRKRLIEEEGQWIICCRTWRIHFSIDEAKLSIAIVKISSGYQDAELNNGEDPYHDKDFHREFLVNQD
ncbi:MAG: tRNA (N6-threonylcarbamoyladenosine(37)-N6)-methyltransferase TrmO [Lentisphaeria bacterium]|nr:tRNA (N6-threonylcarbamoyladenosine(37)-N6)-methyltransferase TrmO [Lentisphaeria bacterium]NQZ68500.1 tRNA (N6-threonylcarbamoyladenosine(37)-N6)-methyltransferase TrmO [Lentisphaeria bacterium]